MPLNVTVPGDQNNNLNIGLQLSAGETVATQLTISSGYPAVPIDLTGYTVKMQIGFSSPFLMDTGNGGITIVDAANGIIQINITAIQSEIFPIGGFPYDLFILSSSDNNVVRLIAGLFTVLQSVTPIS